jgi:hypothetical protein
LLFKTVGTVGAWLGAQLKCLHTLLQPRSRAYSATAAPN